MIFPLPIADRLCSVLADTQTAGIAPSTGGELAPVKGDIEIGLEALNLVVCPVIYERVSVPTPLYFASRSGLVSLKIYQGI